MLNKDLFIPKINTSMQQLLLPPSKRVTASKNVLSSKRLTVSKEYARFLSLTIH